MMPDAGQGKWRLPGRGRRLRCERKRPFYRWNHGWKKPCRMCGYQQPPLTGEIGVFEDVRFITV